MVSWVEGTGGSPCSAFLPLGVMRCLGGGRQTSIDSLNNPPLLFFFSELPDRNTKVEDVSCVSGIYITLDRCLWKEHSVSGLITSETLWSLGVLLMPRISSDSPGF